MKRGPGLALLLAAAHTALLAQGLTPVQAGPSTPPLRSGHADVSPATQALQRGDTQNPAWLWVADGERRFNTDCSSCHTLPSLHGVAIRYPAYDRVLGKPVRWPAVSTCAACATSKRCRGRWKATNCWGWKRRWRCSHAACR